MTIAELIIKLTGYDPKLEVRAFDAECEQFLPVSGIVVDALLGTVDLQTDEL